MKKGGGDIDFCLAKPYMVGLEIEKDGIRSQDKTSHYTCLYVQMRLPMGIFSPGARIMWSQCLRCNLEDTVSAYIAPM